MHVCLLHSVQNIGYFVYCIMRGYFFRRRTGSCCILAGFPLQNSQTVPTSKQFPVYCKIFVFTGRVKVLDNRICYFA